MYTTLLTSVYSSEFSIDISCLYLSSFSILPLLSSFLSIHFFLSFSQSISFFLSLSTLSVHQRRCFFYCFQLCLTTTTVLLRLPTSLPVSHIFSLVQSRSFQLSLSFALDILPPTLNFVLLYSPSLSLRREYLWARFGLTSFACFRFKFSDAIFESSLRQSQSDVRSRRRRCTTFHFPRHFVDAKSERRRRRDVTFVRWWSSLIWFEHTSECF